MEAAPNREHIRNMAEARAHVKRDGGCYIRPIFWPLPRPTTVHGIRHKGRLRKRAHSPRRGQGWSACVAVSHQRQFRAAPPTQSASFNLIVRTIVPFASFDGLFPQTETGLADTLQSFFLSPSRPTQSGIVWGAGPVFLYPTATNAFFAGRQWGAGPTGVVLQINGPWTYGVLANHVWSLTSVPSP